MERGRPHSGRQPNNSSRKIAADNPGKEFDGGFRVFKLDDTNMTDVYYSAGEYDQSMLSMLESNIKPDRTESGYTSFKINYPIFWSRW